MSPAGRPTKLTPELSDSIVAAVRSAQFVEVAAAMVGVHKETLYAWLRRGAEARTKAGRLNDQDRRCREFSDAVGTALAEAEAYTIGGVLEAGRVPATKRVTVTKSSGVGDEAEVTTEERVEELPPDWRALAWVGERRWRRWNLRQLVEAQGAEDGMAGDSGAALTARDQVLSQLEAMTENLEGLASGGLGVESLTEDDDEGGGDQAGDGGGPSGSSTVPDVPEPRQRRGPEIIDPGEAE